MHDIFRIRRGTVQDADIIAWHRARMFQDMATSPTTPLKFCAQKRVCD